MSFVVIFKKEKLSDIEPDTGYQKLGKNKGENSPIGIEPLS